jgi:hypothetical protein
LTHLVRNPYSVGNIERQATMFTHDVIPEDLGVWSGITLRWHVHLRFRLPPIYTEVLKNYRSPKQVKNECTFYPMPRDPIADGIYLIDNRIELSNTPRMFILVQFF